MLSLCCCLTSLQNVSFPTWLKRLCSPSWSSNKTLVLNYDTGTKRHTKLLHSLITGFVQIFGSKIQDLFWDFFQNNNFFFHTQNYQIGDQWRPLKNEGKKCIFHDALQTYKWDWIRFGQHKKKISLLTFKKTLSRLYQYFFQVWKVAGQISRLCMNLEIAYMYSYSFHVGCLTDKQW